MTKKNSTKRTLLASVLALALCCSMLVGTTFAWFTDSVSSEKNVIVAGNLDVELEFKKVVNGTLTEKWETVEGRTDLFDPNALWEPGHAEVVYLKVSNLGNLALKYILSVTVNETAGTNVDGGTLKLSEHLVFKVVEIEETEVGTYDRANIEDASDIVGLKAYEGEAKALDAKDGENDEDYVALIVYMPKSVGDAANYRGDAIPTIELGITLNATQQNAEKDSFGDDYDAGLMPVGDGDILRDVNGIQLLDSAEDGKTYLYLIPEDYAEETVEVPAGVDAIGGYAFAYNKNVKEVILPSTVKSLGRGFDSSTVERVVLNEGLETIDSRAFRSTTALKEVVIPTSVKTIADNAFQKSSLKTITIPATVTTIGEAAFGASLIETVIFEGNTAIQGYAFRGCTQLREVYLNGDDVTFIPSTLNGRNSMFFCNGESNNPGTSNITFYVKNEVVAARVRAALGAEKPETTPIYLDGDVIVHVSNASALQNAINTLSEDDTRIILSAGTYASDLQLTVAALGAAKGNVTFEAAEGETVVLSGTTTLGYRQQGVSAAMWDADITFKNITFDHAEASKHSLDVQDIKSLTLDHCTIIGDGEYGISSANGNGTGASSIVGCKFINAAIQGKGNFCTGLVIDGCEFENSRINIQGGNGVTVQGCTFNNTLSTVHVDDSFYAIRSNSTPITVTGCNINIDSTLTEVATAQAKWYLLCNRGTTDWTVQDVAVTLTDAALAQTELQVTACTSTGAINTTNLTVNGQ